MRHRRKRLDMEEIERLHKRQLARLLSHLEKTGQLTLSLEKDLKRAYGFVFKDIENLIARQDRENEDGISQD
jgi:hypothetical protein